MAQLDPPHREIVVGVDGSPTSVAALRWAIEQAKRSGADVIAVHVWEYPYYGDITGSSGTPSPQVFIEGAHAVLDEAIAAVDVPEGMRVQPEVIEGSASRLLLDRAAGAELLVVGARGRGGFLHLLLGSVATQCVNHATIPVVVVPSVERAD
jgi:nucleotide-binding universal stress UspA family protein